MNDKTYRKHRIINTVNVTELITIHYFEYGKKYRYPGESHDFWEFLYADHGEVWVRCGEKRHHLKQGHGIIYPPNAFHDLTIEEGELANVFIISFTEENNALNDIGGRALNITGNMKSLIRAMIREGTKAFVLPMTRFDRYELKAQTEPMYGAEQMIRLRLEELLILLLRQELPDILGEKEKFHYDDDIAGQIKEFLKANIYQHVTLTDVTGALGFGKTYLSGIFKRVYGKGIMEYYTHMKMDEAKLLLREGKLTINQISDELSFSSPQFFSKRFTQIVHMSPRQYANAVKEDWATIPE